MNKLMKATLGVVTAGMLAFTLSACGSSTTEPTNEPAASPTADVMPEPLASIPALTGVDTQVAVDAGFLDALTSLGLAPGVVGTATLTDGVLAFPITGGNVDYYDPEEDYRPYVQGMIEHDGSGLSLTAGDTVVELTNFTIDPGTSKLFGDVTVNGELAVEQAYLFELWGGTLKPIVMNDDGTAVLEGTTVHISEDAAGLLNETFMTDAVKPGLLVGVAKITVNTN